MRAASMVLPILLFMLCACVPSGGSETETKLKELTRENDSLQTIISSSDSIGDKSRELMESVSDMTYLTVLWVERQSRNDAEEKLMLIQEETHFHLLLEEMKLHLTGDSVDSTFQTVNDKSQEFLALVGEVKRLLSSFESYEDQQKFIIASFIVDGDGELDSIENVLITEIAHLESIANRNKELCRLKIERNKQEIKILAVKE